MFASPNGNNSTETQTTDETGDSLMRPILSDVKGLGPSSVKALASNGIKSVEDLAQADIALISAVPGFGAARAANVKAAAVELLRSAGASEKVEKKGAKPNAAPKDVASSPVVEAPAAEDAEPPAAEDAADAVKKKEKTEKTEKKEKKAKKDKKDKKDKKAKAKKPKTGKKEKAAGEKKGKGKTSGK
jgi:predicted RecB family nuclease